MLTAVPISCRRVDVLSSMGWISAHLISASEQKVQKKANKVNIKIKDLIIYVMRQEDST
jgi:hypothetical protein